MKIWQCLLAIIGAAAVIMGAVAAIKKPKSVYRKEPTEKNPFEGKKVQFVYDDSDPVNADGERGHLEEVPDHKYMPSSKTTFYTRVIKRFLDVVLSFFGLLLLSPLFLILGLTIYLDDPGPVYFTQKRVGKNKQFFQMHKFRSMKMSTPRDIPTHMLENPDEYITKAGRILRKLSMDELPQIWDIFIGNMSIVGPRPALWNQDILTAKRDEYGANDVLPGLTGWAQINGRDELELDEKARIDGDYCRDISFKKDVVCVVVTVVNVLKQEGIIEGGTGILTKYIKNQ